MHSQRWQRDTCKAFRIIVLAAACARSHMAARCALVALSQAPEEDSVGSAARGEGSRRIRAPDGDAWLLLVRPTLPSIIRIALLGMKLLSGEKSRAGRSGLRLRELDFRRRR